MKLKPFVAFIGMMLGLLVVSSCSDAPSFSKVVPQGDEAIFYFYRNQALSTEGEWTSVHLNGKVLARLPENAYSFARLQPGVHNIKLYKHDVEKGDKPRPYYNIAFRVNASEEIYLRWKTLVGNTDKMLPAGYMSREIATSSTEHGFVDAQTGYSEIVDTRLAQPEMTNAIKPLY